MKIKTKIAILNGELKAKPDVKDWPIETDGRVERGVTLITGEHLPKALADDWVKRGKAVEAADEKKADPANGASKA
jgi:hypothetical protein